MASIRGRLSHVLPILLSLASSAMCWKGLQVATNTPNPVLVVMSGSMQPAFYRGDMILLWNRTENIQTGDIPVYHVAGRDIPIVHRAISTYWTKDEHGSKPV